MKSGDEITPEEDLVNEWRLQKGDLQVAVNIKGKISRAVPADLTIIKELVRRGVFPYHYEIYGTGFLELRNAFRAPWAIRTSAVLLEQWGIGISEGKANEIYENVCKKIGSNKIKLVEFVIEEMKNRETRSHHIENKVAFDKLVEAMDEERSRIFAERGEI